MLSDSEALHITQALIFEVANFCGGLWPLIFENEQFTNL
jgi:hypothetical protein